jgi:hypothetical protein
LCRWVEKAKTGILRCAQDDDFFTAAALWMMASSLVVMKLWLVGDAWVGWVDA